MTIVTFIDILFVCNKKLLGKSIIYKTFVYNFLISKNDTTF